MLFSFDLLTTLKSLPRHLLCTSMLFIKMFLYWRLLQTQELNNYKSQEVPETIHKVHPSSGSNQQTVWERGMEFHLSWSCGVGWAFQ